MCRFWHPTGTLYIAELRHFAVYIRTGGAGQEAFHGMDGIVHDWVRVSFPVRSQAVPQESCRRCEASRSAHESHPASAGSSLHEPPAS